VRDVSGQGNHGGLQNQNPTTTTVGKIGQGLSFDGVDDYVSAGDINSLDTATELTVCVWAYHGSITSDDAIIAKEDVVASNGFLLFRDDVGFSSGRTDVYTFAIWDSADTGTARIETPSNTTQLSVWTHVCGTFLANNASGLKLYVNGVGVGDNGVSTVGISAISAGSNALVVGARSDWSMPFDGNLDEVRAYNRALSADEVKRLYLMGASLKTNVTHRDELTSGLVGEWTFDGKDMTPNVRDVSGQGNNGGLQNQNPTTTTIGKIGQGLNFDGVDDKINVGTGSSLNITTAITVNAWIYPTSFGDRARIVDRLGSNVGYIFLLDNTNTTAGLGFGVNAAGSISVDYGYATNVITLNRWQHIAVTYSGSGTLSFYVNGVKVTTAANMTQSIGSSASTPLYIAGRFADSLRLFSGRMDEVRIYNRVLSPDEIQRLYLMGK